MPPGRSEAMPLPDSLARLRYDRLGPRRFKTVTQVAVDLPYFIPSAKSSAECAEHPRVEIVRTESTGAARLIARPGFVWNGASGPTWDSESIRRSALVHDALYGLIRSGDLAMAWRKAADLCFRELLKRGGVNGVRRRYYFWAVRWFGKRACRPPKGSR